VYNIEHTTRPKRQTSSSASNSETESTVKLINAVILTTGFACGFLNYEIVAKNRAIALFFAV
jgi:hypothetical protein